VASLQFDGLIAPFEGRTALYLSTAPSGISKSNDETKAPLLLKEGWQPLRL